MIRYIQNLLTLPILLWSFYRNSRIQNAFIRKTVLLDLEDIENKHDDSLSSSDLKKIKGYYGSSVPSILGESFCVLRGRPMSDTERLGLTYLGALTGLFDDFFDEKNTPEEHIRDMITHPFEDLAENSHEKLVVRFFQKAMKVTDGELLVRNALIVHEDQIQSKEQLQESITLDRIKDITYRKGGDSILFYRSIFQSPPEAEEREMLFSMGAVGQLANDVFDIYDDYEDGIKTIPTTATTIKEVRQEYLKQVIRTFKLINQSHFPKQNKRRFIRYFSLIASRALVALDFLEKNEADTDGHFKIECYSRSQLVCDMGQAHNVLRMFHYFAKITPRSQV